MTLFTSTAHGDDTGQQRVQPAKSPHLPLLYFFSFQGGTASSSSRHADFRWLLQPLSVSLPFFEKSIQPLLSAFAEKSTQPLSLALSLPEASSQPAFCLACLAFHSDSLPLPKFTQPLSSVVETLAAA